MRIRALRDVPPGVVVGERPSPLFKSWPSEESEHLRVVAALRAAEVYFVHVPMGGARARRGGAAMRRMGARPGFPDFLILDPPLEYAGCPGVAIELKRPVAGSLPTQAQFEELGMLAARGWLAYVEFGADAVLGRLRSLDYPVG